MPLGKDYDSQDCSLARSLELLGERWTLLIVRDALYGVRRFSDFLARLDCPKAVLSERLRVLVAAGVLEKRPYGDSPARSEYVLTGKGADLWPAIYHLGRWSQVYEGAEAQRLFFHAECGTRLTGPVDCPDCGAVAVGDIEMRPGPGARRTDPVSRALAGPRRMLEPVRL